jgi:hypothetical protein
VHFQYFCDYFPDDAEFSDGDLICEFVEEGFVEIILDDVAEAVEGAVAGGGVCAVADGKTQPPFALRWVPEHLAVVVGQEGEDPRELERGEGPGALVGEDGLDGAELVGVVAEAVGEDREDQQGSLCL